MKTLKVLTIVAIIGLVGITASNAWPQNANAMRPKQTKVQRNIMQSMFVMGQFVSTEGFDKQGFIDMAMKKCKDRIEMKANMFEQKMNILTPEQRAKLVSLLQEKKQ